MKLSENVINSYSNNGNAHRQRFPPPPVPLVVPESTPLKKGESMKIVLKSNPKDKESKEYSITVPYFKQGTPQEWIYFCKAFQHIIDGQSLESGPSKFQMARVLLQGDALRVFNVATAKAENEETNETFKTCVKAVTKHVFPDGALKRQKRYMRRYMRKPRFMKAREMMARGMEMNDDLKYYPDYKESKRLDEDEMCDIIEFGLPGRWQKTMYVQGFDIADHSYDELMDMAERLETAEDIYEANYKNREPSAKPHAKHGSKKRAYGPSESPDGDRSRLLSRKRNHADRSDTAWCPYHAVNTHDMNECKVLIDQAKKMRAQFVSQPAAKRQKRSYRPEAKKFEPSKEEMYEFCKSIYDEEQTRAKKSRASKTAHLKRDTDDEMSVSEDLHAFDHLKIDTDSDVDWDDVAARVLLETVDSDVDSEDEFDV